MSTIFLGAGLSSAGFSSAGYGQVVTSDSFVVQKVTANTIDPDSKDFVLGEKGFEQIDSLTSLVYLRLATVIGSSGDFNLGNSIGEMKTFGTNSKFVVENKIINCLKDLSDLIVVDDINVSFVGQSMSVQIDFTNIENNTSGRINL